MRKLMLITALFLCGFVAMAQKRVVKGQVKDNYGIPLIGVTVTIQGTNEGTTTDISGYYEIICENKDTLVFSYIGAETERIRVGNKPYINVTLYHERTSYASQDEISSKFEVVFPKSDIKAYIIE